PQSVDRRFDALQRKTRRAEEAEHPGPAHGGDDVDGADAVGHGAGDVGVAEAMVGTKGRVAEIDEAARRKGRPVRQANRAANSAKRVQQLRGQGHWGESGSGRAASIPLSYRTAHGGTEDGGPRREYNAAQAERVPSRAMIDSHIHVVRPHLPGAGALSPKLD